MLEKFEKTNEFDMMELFLDGHFSQGLSIVPNGFIGDAQNVWSDVSVE
jgi:hypothetical protein